MIFVAKSFINRHTRRNTYINNIINNVDHRIHSMLNIVKIFLLETPAVKKISLSFAKSINHIFKHDDLVCTVPEMIKTRKNRLNDFCKDYDTKNSQNHHLSNCCALCFARHSPARVFIQTLLINSLIFQLVALVFVKHIDRWRFVFAPPQCSAIK